MEELDVLIWRSNHTGDVGFACYSLVPDFVLPYSFKDCERNQLYAYKLFVGWAGRVR